MCNVQIEQENKQWKSQFAVVLYIHKVFSSKTPRQKLKTAIHHLEFKLEQQESQTLGVTNTKVCMFIKHSAGDIKHTIGLTEGS